MIKKKVFTFLPIILLFLIPLANSIIFNPYPAEVVHFTSYGTYLMWNQTITCDSLTVNATYANFVNITVGLGSLLSSFNVSVQSGNASLNQLLQNSLSYITLSGLNQNATVQLTYPQKPTHVYQDGTAVSEGNDWAWNTANSTLTLWDVLSGSTTSSQFELDTSAISITPPTGGPLGNSNTTQTQNSTVTFYITNKNIPFPNVAVLISSLSNFTDQFGNATFTLAYGLYTYQILYQGIKIAVNTLNVTSPSMYVSLNFIINAESSGIVPQITNWAMANFVILILVILALLAVLAYSERKKR